MDVGVLHIHLLILWLISASQGIPHHSAIVKKMTPERTVGFARADRTAVGHRVTVTYRAVLLL